jgi:ribonuclease P protein component
LDQGEILKRNFDNKPGTDFGLKKRERIVNRKEVSELFKTGRRVQSGPLTIIFSPGSEQKAGFIASRQIGGAVKRNKAKRILREAYRMHKDIFGGRHIILFAHGSITRAEVMAAFERFRRKRGK